MPLGKNHLRRHAPRGGKWNPLAIVGLCLVAAILITAIVGNCLRIWLDDETYGKYTTGLPEPPAPERVQTAVPNLRAYPYVPGQAVDSVLGFSSVALPINQTDGTLRYTSDVIRYLGLTPSAKTELTSMLGELCTLVPYVSGVFYPQAPAQIDPDLRYATAVQEAAILREFDRAGGAEILLCGIDTEAIPMTDLLEYLQVLRAALGNTAIGIALPPSAAQAENGWERIGELMRICDFCVLDLTGETVDPEPADHLGLSLKAAELLTNAGYLLTQYDMRILLCSTQLPLLEYLEFYAYEDFQVLP